MSEHSIEKATGVALQAYNIIRNFQVVGHSLADVDPLGKRTRINHIFTDILIRIFLELGNFKEFGKKSLQYNILGDGLTEAEKQKTFSIVQGPWIKEVAVTSLTL